MPGFAVRRGAVTAFKWKLAKAARLLDPWTCPSSGSPPEKAPWGPAKASLGPEKAPSEPERAPSRPKGPLGARKGPSLGPLSESDHQVTPIPLWKSAKIASVPASEVKRRGAQSFL